MLFAVLAVGAAILIRYVTRAQWFGVDEWDVLYGRTLSSPGSMLRSHWGHPILFPAIAYQLLYRVFGLHHYWPYQAMVIGAHLAVALGIRLVLRHSRVNPWLATIALVPFLVLGAGRLDLAWGFQVTLTGALAFGIAQVLLVDHGGSFNRRDLFALAAGSLAIGFSAVGALMLIPAALTAGLRRGWRPALFQLVPPGLLFALWRTFAPSDNQGMPAAMVGEAVGYARGLLVHSITGFAQHLLVAVLLLAGTGVGWWLLARQDDLHLLAERYASTASLAFAAVVTALVIGRTRGAPKFLDPHPNTHEPRYIYLIVALLLPALVVGLDRLARGSRPRTIGVVLLLLAPVPGNIAELGLSGSGHGQPIPIAVYAEVADRVQVNRSFHPLGPYVSVTAGALADAHRRGKIPAPPPGSREELSSALLSMVLAPVSVGPRSVCDAGPTRAGLRVRRGDRFQVSAPTNVAEVVRGRAVGTLSVSPAVTMVVLWGPVDLVVRGGPANARMQRCA